MIRVLKASLKIDSIKNIRILFFNKTTKDIIWKEKLEELKLNYANKISLLLNVLSQETSSEWNGIKGRINKDLLNKYIISTTVNNDDNNDNYQQLYCICGPKEFNQITLEYKYFLFIYLENII